MKLRLGAATFVATTLLMGGGVAYSLTADEPSDDVVVTEPSVDEPTTDAPEVEEPETEEPETEEPETEEPETEEPETDEPETDEPEGEEGEKPGGPEAAAAHHEAMAAWKDCVAGAVEAAPTALEPIDVLALCGTKPAPPGKAVGWDGEKVSKNAQKKVDKAAGVEHAKPEKAPKPDKAPKAKGKGHQR